MEQNTETIARRLLVVACVLLALAPDPALAYIGPGAGLSALGTVVAFIAAFLLLIVGFIWYPIKRLLRKMRKAPSSDKAGPTGSKE